MKNHDITRVRQVANAYVENELDFSEAIITSITEVPNDVHLGSESHVVTLELMHSEQRILELSSTGDPGEADLKREFLEGVFKLKLTVCGEAVVSVEWENTDICS